MSDATEQHQHPDHQPRFVHVSSIARGGERCEWSNYTDSTVRTVRTVSVVSVVSVVSTVCV